MPFTHPDGTLCRFHEAWRVQLIEAELHMRRDKNPATKAEYIRVLRIFKDLVMYGMLPRE